VRIIWSALALGRVSEAADYIARDNPRAAENWVSEIFDLVSRLSEHPQRGRVVPEVGRAEIRELFFGSYRVIYRVEQNRVVILTVRHGRRLLEKAELSNREE